MEKCPVNIECCTEKRMLFIKNGYPVMDCITCHRRFSEIQEGTSHLSTVYSDKYFFEGKDGYPNYLNEKEILTNYGIYYAKILERFAKPGKILDVGCAAGFILNGFESMGWEPYGIEPNETMASYGRNTFKLNIQTGSLENFQSAIKFDLVSLIQVIGHFYQVEKALENISNLLDPNGIVLVESWNMKSLIARILGKYWHEYSPPSVINWFSDKSLMELFKAYGFELIDSGYPAKQINLKHALSLLEKNSTNLLFRDKIFRFLTNSLGNLTLIYPPVDLKWYIFRKL
jgi:SAM-dependent methyltransferase